MLVQYIFLRSDLKSFSRGSIVAQACHASLKAVHTFINHRDVQDYLNSPNMTTIILKITELDLKSLEVELKNLDYVKWVERPEEIVTCISLRPYETEDLIDKVSNIKKYKLF